LVGCGTSRHASVYRGVLSISGRRANEDAE
jgi:hypothetical protein